MKLLTVVVGWCAVIEGGGKVKVRKARQMQRLKSQEEEEIYEERNLFVRVSVKWILLMVSEFSPSVMIVGGIRIRRADGIFLSIIFET